jgi:hypothetical protein
MNIKLLRVLLSGALEATLCEKQGACLLAMTNISCTTIIVLALRCELYEIHHLNGSTNYANIYKKMCVSVFV